MNNKNVERRNFIKWGATALGAATLLPLAGCAFNDENDSKDTTTGFSKDEKFLESGESFDYYNKNQLDQFKVRRSQKNLSKHKPRLTRSKNKHEFIVDFKNTISHPHVYGHWWVWIEIWDGKDGYYFHEYPEPSTKDDFYGMKGTDFQSYFFTKKELSGKIRVRAYCNQHGIYTNYYTLD